MFHLKLLINLLSLSIVGSNWLARLGRNTQDRLSLRWSQVDLQLHRADPSGLPCVDAFSWRRMFWHVRCDPIIVMAAYNNNDILMVPYEDLPNGHKDVISKAIEEFQNKCLLSYTKTRDNTIVQKISTTQSSVAWADRCRWDWRQAFLHESYKQVCSWCHIEP